MSDKATLEIASINTTLNSNFRYQNIRFNHQNLHIDHDHPDHPQWPASASSGISSYNDEFCLSMFLVNLIATEASLLNPVYELMVNSQNVA